MPHDHKKLPPGTRRLTPVDRSTGKRLELIIDNQEIPRGHPWTRILVDHRTGKRFRLWQKSCGLPGCLCDAYAEEVGD